MINILGQISNSDAILWSHQDFYTSIFHKHCLAYNTDTSIIWLSANIIKEEEEASLSLVLNMVFSRINRSFPSAP